jgi:hypothetical protein
MTSLRIPEDCPPLARPFPTRPVCREDIEDHLAHVRECGRDAVLVLDGGAALCSEHAARATILPDEIDRVVDATFDVATVHLLSAMRALQTARESVDRAWDIALSRGDTARMSRVLEARRHLSQAVTELHYATVEEQS